MLKSVEYLEKIAVFETLRHGLKALYGTVVGGKHLNPGAAGLLHNERTQAVNAGNALMKQLEQRGVDIHRARIKSPGSMQAKGITSVPDDLLGMQTYMHTPEDVTKTLAALKEMGVESTSKYLNRPGYAGVNIKGNYQGTPFELQGSPSRLTNLAQQMDHSLTYKPETEAPYMNVIDRLVGKHLLGKAVRKGNWMEHPGSLPEGLRVKKAEDTSSYILEGAKLQGVGLRKHLHKILNEMDAKGLAVNDPYTGNVYMTVEKSHADEAKKKLNSYLEGKGLEPAQFHAAASQKLKRVEIDAVKAKNYVKTHGLSKITPEQIMPFVAERYNLTPSHGKLQGYVTADALKQLQGKAPAYEMQLTNPSSYPGLKIKK